MEKQTTEQIIENLIDSLNVMGSDEEKIQEVVNAVNHSHPTLQASFVRVVVKGFASKYAEKEHTDARNEYAVGYCKKITEVGKNEGIPFI
jgi:hypothetical protein